MKLNHDCVRHLLLAIEKHTTVSKHLNHDEILKLSELEPYDDEIIIYTAQKLNEAGFINGTFDFFMDDMPHIAISSLTYEGHNFLDTIRDHKVWRKTKETASKLSSVSITVMSEIGVSIARGILGLS